jgi:hypothetical protein
VNDWPFYLVSESSGALRSTAVNLLLSSPAPQQHRPNLAGVWVYMLMPNFNGLTDEAEASQLEKIEKALTDFFHKEFDAEYVAQLNREGRFEMWFYTDRLASDLTTELVPVMGWFPNYKFTAGCRPDPNWAAYFEDFYPNDPKSRFQILNFEQLQRLEQQGDPLSSPHAVVHTLFFKTAESRTEFVTQALEEGFEKIDEFEDPSGAVGAPFAVGLRETCTMDLPTMNRSVWKIIDLMSPYSGEYCGWRTFVRSD